MRMRTDVQDIENDYRMALRACQGGFVCFFAVACLCVIVVASGGLGRSALHHTATSLSLRLQEPTPTPRETLLVQRREPFDCQSAPADGASNVMPWSFEKQVWCCEHYTVGCPTKSVPSTSTTVPYDCQRGYTFWKEMWPVDKKAYCCKHFFPLGCEASATVKSTTVQKTTTTEPFNCQDDGNTASWLEERREWCCSREGVACHEAVPHHERVERLGVFNCQAGLRDAERLWTADKKAYCCDRQRLGCPTHSVDQVGSSRNTFSKGAAACSAHCKVDGLNSTCAGRIRWAAAFMFQSKDDACERGHAFITRGCPHCDACPLQEVHCKALPPYECGSGDEMRWTDAKRRWCCKQSSLGCTSDDLPGEPGT